MSESLVSEWLDENRYRAFPLKEDAQRTSGGFTLDDGVVLDAYFHIESDVAVELASITVASGVLTVATTLDIFDVPLPITGESTTVTKATGSKITIGSSANDIADGTYTFSGVFFEDSVVVYYNAAWLGVSSVKFGDLSPVAGAVSIFPRVNTYLGAGDANTLIWSVGKNQGTPPDNCVVYGGLPGDCGTQVSFINGVTGNSAKQFNLTAGSGLKVTPDPANNRLLISLTFDATKICPPIPPSA